MQGVDHSAFNIQHSVFSIHRSLFSTPRARNARGSALIETAIVLPLYLIVLFGLIYFGYATLSKQRQALAAAYTAWHPAKVQADELLDEFWPWEGGPEVLWRSPGRSEARAGDTVLTTGETTSFGDDYYGTLVPSQLTGGPGSLGGGAGDTFDRERIAVSLWTYAYAELIQSYSLPLQQRIRRRWDDAANYLNPESDAQRHIELYERIGFIEADEGSPPSIGRYERLIADALNGDDPGWIERPRITLQTTYKPPFFKMIYREEDAPATDFATFVTGDYPEPEYEPTSTVRFDLTTRGEGFRRAAGEDGVTSDQLIAATRDFLDGGELSSPGSMDGLLLGNLGTLEQLWSAR